MIYYLTSDRVEQSAIKLMNPDRYNELLIRSRIGLVVDTRRSADGEWGPRPADSVFVRRRTSPTTTHGDNT